ncbi:hypothetical protein BSZ35_19040 [Salinibacter sp. 10B]|uniref:hypothetical protein n=1 Tax=Salinibacter sp. 10B TaxID=1923971 RepID=UPI000CF3CD79|nr:hypothetical protein [Salinibacter sp. 10B]PQJ26746.1 hypothetical protein BSZ35_19040 [Salinibacter sp. 10B]
MADLDADDVRQRLTESDYRQIFRDLGFKDVQEERPNADGWIGKLHGPPALGEGRKGNFSVNLQHGGVRDHGDEGYSGDVFQAVMDVKHMDFGEALEYVASEAGIETESQDWAPREGQVVARYPYHNLSGDVVFEQVREEPPAGLNNPSRSKSFYPEVPGEGIGLHGREKIPYRIPEFSAQSEGGPEFVTYHEGEKDVDNMRELNIPATTTPFGANSFDANVAAPHFEGLHVAIFPDNDDEGDSHASQVANALINTAESVKVVRLDERPSGGGDVSDWIGKKREEGLNDEEIRMHLLNAIENAPTFSPTTNGHTSNSDPAQFWYFDGETSRYKIDRAGLIRFLEDQGFGKFYGESDLQSMLVRVEDNIVRRTSRENIKDFALRYVRNLDLDNGEQVVDALLRGANVYFSDALFEFLSPMDLQFHRDTATAAYFYFQNGFVEVTAEGYELHSYDELDGVIWEDQVINRKFVDLTDRDDYEDWEWHQHLYNVAGQENDRHHSLCTALGFLQHGYKDPAVTKAVILMDEKDADVEEGRTGKSLTSKALQHTCPTLRIDGRNFSFDSRFAFQEVGLDTQVVDFNDIRKRFPFERLFSLITDDFPVERKGQDRVTIPFEDSPKFLLSTNYVVEGEGASFDDRTFQVEFADYYSPEHTPEDEFGHRLFDDWEKEEWAQFFNVMMACVRLYLRDGLTDYDRKNVAYRRLKQQTCPDFAEWAVDFIEPGKEYEKDALWRTFRDAYSPDYEDLTKRKMGYWLSAFARIYSLEKNQSKRRRNGSRIRYVTFEQKE